MAPTICMTEHVLTRQEKASPYFCRRRLQFKRNVGHESNVASGRTGSTILQHSSTWRSRCPPDSSLSESSFKEHNDECSAQLDRREGLINIIIRTLSLMRRNHLLQLRVDALRAETQEFINSVMINPSNSALASKTSLDEQNSTPGSPLSDQISQVSLTTQEDQVLSDVECTNDAAPLSVDSTVTTTVSSNSNLSSDDF